VTYADRLYKIQRCFDVARLTGFLFDRRMLENLLPTIQCQVERRVLYSGDIETRPLLRWYTTLCTFCYLKVRYTDQTKLLRVSHFGKITSFLFPNLRNYTGFHKGETVNSEVKLV